MQNCAVKMAVAPCLNIKYEYKRVGFLLLLPVVTRFDRQVVQNAPK